MSPEAKAPAVEVEAYVTWQGEGRVRLGRRGALLALLDAREAADLRDELDVALTRLDRAEQDE